MARGKRCPCEEYFKGASALRGLRVCAPRSSCSRGLDESFEVMKLVNKGVIRGRNEMNNKRCIKCTFLFLSVAVVEAQKIFLRRC